jgi:hypothetical protein
MGVHRGRDRGKGKIARIAMIANIAGIEKQRLIGDALGFREPVNDKI